jgi:hypothetical protein
VGGVPAILAPAHAQVASAIQTPPMKDEVFTMMSCEHVIQLKLSGNEVYCIACSFLVKSAVLAPAHAQVSSAIQTPPMKDEVCADISYENIIMCKVSGNEG